MLLNFDWIVSNTTDRKDQLLLNNKEIKINLELVNWLEDEGSLDYNSFGEKIYFYSIDETDFKRKFNRKYTEIIS